MSKRIKDTKYLYLSILLRARENKLVTRERIERFVDAKTLEEAVKILEECGYPELSPLTLSVLEDRLSQRRDSMFAELADMVPNPNLIDVFRVKYDYHNAKTMIKAEATGSDPRPLFSGSGRVAPAVFYEACVQNSFRDLPVPLANAIGEAKEVLARTQDPQQMDMLLDQAYFAEFLAMVNRCGSPFLTGYAKLLVDGTNLRIAVRAARVGKDAGFLRKALIPGGDIRVEDLIAAVNAQSSLAALYFNSLLLTAATIGDEVLAGTKQLTAFEKACDNAQVAYLDRAHYQCFGVEVVIAYLCALEGELAAVRIVVSGRLAGLSPDAIRERLRDLYV